MCNLVKLNSGIAKIEHRYTESLRLTIGTLSQAVKQPAWGIDPGRNFGLTILEGEDAYIYAGVLEKTDVAGRYGWYAHNFLEEIIREYHQKKARLVIEGASYGDQYGQVLLAEIRGGFFLAGVSAPNFSSVVISPPKKIRKEVFNDGTIRAPDEWPTLNRNAADSLAMALFAAEMEC